jgi:transposase
MTRNKEVKGHKSFARTPEGLAALSQWVKDEAGEAHVWAIMEATGDLWYLPALKLHEAGLPLSVVNPAQLYHYAKTLKRRHKTDQQDAHLLALFGMQVEPRQWKPVEAVRLELRAIMRRLDQLGKMKRQEKTRQKSEELDQEVEESLKRMVGYIEKEEEELWKKAYGLVEKNEELSKEVELLDTIPAIGPQTAYRLVAELMGIERFTSAKQLASWAGLIPRHFQSGTSVHKPDKLCQEGSRPIRGILYMPALVAMQHNGAIKALNDRLKATGKHGLTRVAAAMHKLLRQVFAVLTHQQPFDPKKALSG